MLANFTSALPASKVKALALPVEATVLLNVMALFPVESKVTGPPALIATAPT